MAADAERLGVARSAAHRHSLDVDKHRTFV
jgi:hypothetical protein